MRVVNVPHAALLSSSFSGISAWMFGWFSSLFLRLGGPRRHPKCGLMEVERTHLSLWNWRKKRWTLSARQFCLPLSARRCDAKEELRVAWGCQSCFLLGPRHSLDCRRLAAAYVCFSCRDFVVGRILTVCCFCSPIPFSGHQLAVNFGFSWA